MSEHWVCCYPPDCAKCQSPLDVVEVFQAFQEYQVESAGVFGCGYPEEIGATAPAESPDFRFRCKTCEKLFPIEGEYKFEADEEEGDGNVRLFKRIVMGTGAPDPDVASVNVSRYEWLQTYLGRAASEEFHPFANTTHGWMRAEMNKSVRPAQLARLLGVSDDFVMRPKLYVPFLRVDKRQVFALFNDTHNKTEPNYALLVRRCDKDRQENYDSRDSLTRVLKHALTNARMTLGDSRHEEWSCEGCISTHARTCSSLEEFSYRMGPEGLARIVTWEQRELAVLWESIVSKEEDA